MGGAQVFLQRHGGARSSPVIPVRSQCCQGLGECALQAGCNGGLQAGCRYSRQG